MGLIKDFIGIYPTTIVIYWDLMRTYPPESLNVVFWTVLELNRGLTGKSSMQMVAVPSPFFDGVL